MSELPIPEEKIKEIVKESLSEILSSNKSFFGEILARAIEDIDLAKELRRAQQSKEIQQIESLES